jgi:hypothetical protein
LTVQTPDPNSATELRDTAEKLAAGDLQKAYRELAVERDPLGDPVLLAHDARYFREQADRTIGDISKGYRDLAEKRERVGQKPPQPTRHPIRQTSSEMLYKSAQRRR